nr:1-deoxy-D-xylulose-5-phosphate reductoisomerase [bacterium]
MADVPEKTIAVLGSTGSIGTNTLDVVRRSRGRYRVAALAAGRNLRLLEEQAQEFSPALACVDRAEDARMLQGRLGKKVRVVSGEEGLFETAGIPAADMVLVAIPGVVALLPTLAAIEAGKAIALASKEILVSAGDLFMAAVDRCEAEVIPV